jgi:GWxTD domain-containing protein
VDPERVLLRGFKRLKPKKVNTIVQAIDIKGLGSGEYVLSAAVFDQSKQKLSETRVEFIRSNPEADQHWVENSGRLYEDSFTKGMEADSVRYALKAIAPKISQIQVPVLNYLIQKGELDNQRRFLHQYWLETDPISPEHAYQEYMRLVAIVDQHYHSAFGYGFETDRGHILLKYGFPNDKIEVDDEPSAPPYEIWFYNDFPVTGQSDVRFLFYNPSLAGGDYRLLHSTAIGEVQNPRWQMTLYSDAITETEPGDFMNARDVRDNVHRRAAEYFND